MRYIRNILYSIALFFFCNTEIHAQQCNSKAADEKVSVFTDRNLYISGEKINFSVVLCSDKASSQQSKIIYIDLIAANRQKILQKKYLLVNSIVNSQISLPKKIITGEYYLRAYTKFMRNFSQASFAYVLLKIVNPENNEIIEATKQTPVEIDSNQIMQTNAIIITANKQFYHKKDTISVMIRPKIETKDYYFCLSVVPKFSISDPVIILPTNYSIKEKLFSKESTGFSVSGKMIQSKTQKPYIFTNIYLSIKKDKNLLPAYTDTNGRFNFTPDFLTGQKEIYISADLINQKYSAKYLLDNDFAEIPKDLVFPKFTLNTQEKKLFLKMARNSQISRLYHPQDVSKSIDTICNSTAFYGHNFSLINFDDYILFRTLAEYFTEIDLPVKIVKTKNSREFRIRGTQPELFIYKPLLMLDWVEVQDAECILSIAPTKMSHIEIIDSAYLRGNFIFGGIINFITNKGDFGDSKLPASTVRLKYNFLSSIDYQTNETKISKNIPDAKNTIFWKSGIKLPMTPQKQFKIIAGDVSGQYLILLRGINKQGQTIQVSADFEIR